MILSMAEINLSKLIASYNLPEKALPYLDCIKYQKEEPNETNFSIKSDLELMCNIAVRYKNPVQVLSIIDSAMERYTQLKASKALNLGSIVELNHYDEIAQKSNGRNLVLNGLNCRIEEHLLSSHKIKPYRIPYGHSFTKNAKTLFD